MLFLGRDGEMHAELQRGIERAGLGDLKVNHGHGTMTEPESHRPRRARSRKAVFAPWHMPRSSILMINPGQVVRGAPCSCLASARPR